jgi:FMN reductase
LSTTPVIVGIGGTTVAGSSTELALQVAAAAARSEGADVKLFNGEQLAALPHYEPGIFATSQIAQALVESIRRADGLLIASPGYHGSISGLVKNAIDYLEETSKDARVYLDGLPVGLIVTAYGWQATGSTLGTLRSIVHALRGFPTPMGAAIKSGKGLFVDGQCTDRGAAAQLSLVGRQVAGFARLRLREPSATVTGPE